MKTDQPMNEGLRTEYGMCPKCMGEGMCDNTGNSTSVKRICSLCNGTKFIVTAQTNESSKLKEKDENLEGISSLYREALKECDRLKSQLQASNAMAERLIELLGDAQANSEQYGYLTYDVIQRIKDIETEYQNSKK